MGMTIDKTIEFFTGLECHTPQAKDARDVAVDTMRKYQKIDKSAMMHEIYMAGVNMAGEYQGCWVRFKEIEKIVDRYVR